MSFTQQVATEVLPALATLVAAALTALVGLGSKWLSDHVKDARGKALIASVTEAVDTAVKDVSNNEADALRKANGDFSSAQRAALRKIAVDKAKSLLGEATLANLAKTFGYSTDQQMIDFLASYVEKGVWLMKLQVSAAAAAPPVAPAAAKLPTK